MYNQNATQVLQEQPATEMKSLFMAIQDQNERYFQIIGNLENAGSRLRSSGEGKESSMQTPKPMSTGLIYDLGEQIERFRLLNGRLQDLCDKFNSLI